MRVEACATLAEISGFTPSGALPPFHTADFETQRADLHLCAIDENGLVEARSSLWWSQTPPFKEHRVGTIGHYASLSSESAAVLIAEAEKRLAAAGCTLAIGPMNGNTWRSYRFVTEVGDRPPFFLEPTNPPEWPVQFTNAAFTPIASYFSAINTDLTRADARLEISRQRAADVGVSIRLARDLKQELAGIYAVSRIAFRHNFLYTELPERDFAAMYEPVLPHTRPDLVLMAEREGECVGYLFAIPDLAQAMRGQPIDTFIIKTVAILPDTELKGLGSLLVSSAQEAGREAGFCKCIHALMFENNISLNISRHYASIMRKYTLFAKELRG